MTQLVRDYLTQDGQLLRDSSPRRYYKKVFTHLSRGELAMASYRGVKVLFQCCPTKLKM